MERRLGSVTKRNTHMSWNNEPGFKGPHVLLLKFQR
jgi:hypothetical protein